MAVSVAAVMRQINKFFVGGYRSGDFAITGGALSPAPSCGYVYIQGSKRHDGVWAVSGDMLTDLPDGLPDETFTGRVYELNPPGDFLALCGEISSYDDAHPVGEMQSETFGDYSYTRASAQGGEHGWQSEYRTRLNAYRTRMYTEVDDL